MKEGKHFHYIEALYALETNEDAQQSPVRSRTTDNAQTPHKVTSNIRFGVQGADMDPK